MRDPLAEFVGKYYEMEIIKIEKIADHTAKVYRLESATQKYILKEMQPSENVEYEGDMIDHLISKGIRVPRIYRTLAGSHVFKENGLQYILYEYIEGAMVGLNEAPNWYLMKSAQTLGRIQSALKDYQHRPGIWFGQEYFTKEKYSEVERDIFDRIKQAEDDDDASLIAALNQRIRHIKRVSSFDFDCGKLTYVATHADFYVNQTIVRNGELVTIDWTHPGTIPACFEVLYSYTYAAPECKGGAIDIQQFKPYLMEYLKYAPVELSRYDYQMMPYLLYVFCVVGAFTPPYAELPTDYLKIANLTDNLANWLFENVDALSEELCALHA